MPDRLNCCLLSLTDLLLCKETLFTLSFLLSFCSSAGKLVCEKQEFQKLDGWFPERGIACTVSSSIVWEVRSLGAKDTDGNLDFALRRAEI